MTEREILIQLKSILSGRVSEQSINKCLKLIDKQLKEIDDYEEDIAISLSECV